MSIVFIKLDNNNYCLQIGTTVHELSLSDVKQISKQISKKTGFKPETNKRHWYGYLLELENYKFYVGMTTNVKARYRKHCSGTGAKWTKIHKPIRVMEVRDFGELTMSEASELEHDMLLEFQLEYSEHIRGGKECKVSRG